MWLHTGQISKMTTRKHASSFFKQIIKTTVRKYTCFIHHRSPKPNYYQIGCLDNAFDLVNRIWRYSGNQINTVVFMICCNGRSVYSKGCVCCEQNLSCTELCPCQALDLSHNVITQRSKNMLFKCVFTRRKSHQSRIFDSFQFHPQFVQIDMASFRPSLRIIQPWY
jgi:hypothetical protein